MKKHIITATLILASLSGMAQTLRYKAIVTNHYKGDFKASQTVKYSSGNINVSPELITLENEAYTVLKHGETTKGDENYTAQNLIVVTKAKTGSYKVMDCILLYSPKNAISEVIFKKTKSTIVSYVID